MLKRLPTLLSGKAFAVFERLAAEAKEDYKTLTKALTAAFGGDTMGKHLAMMAFRSRTRKPDEDIQVFAYNLEALLRRAMPKSENGDRDVLLQQQFIERVPTELKRELLQRPSMSYEEMVAVAQQLDLASQISSHQTGSQVNLASASDNLQTTTRDQPLVAQLMENVETLTRKTGALLSIKGCLVFMDDIIIFSDTGEERQRILDEVFRRIRAAGLKIKRDKCQFAQESVKFLGHIVSARGTEPDSSKVEAVREFAIPTSLTDVRAFVGMASYYRRFIKNFADIAAPLHDLTKGGQLEFCWTPVADKAFNDLKSRLCSAPILSLPDFSVPFTIYTDASDFGLGAVLSQRRGEN
ncbi:Retrovirus-related Pol poly from transposon, partial [Paramuricea clavata]